MPKIAPLFIVLYFFVSEVQGQILGNEPSNTKWRIIRTPLTNVIFEEGSERLAFRAASVIKNIGGRDSSFIGGPAQNIPVILHGNSVLPAGVPTLAPIKSDWTITAPQTPFMGVVPWIDLLSIHEYRHHQQMQRAKKGWFTEISRGLLGQTGWFINVLMIQPTWFFEGDATYAETMLTNSGRGRTPMFEMEYRAMRLSGMHFNYEKAIRNSRKDFVPNIYRQGYYMTTYARKYFGVDVWTKVLDDTYKRKGLFYPFTRSLKRFTGLKTPKLYEATMHELDSIWKIQDLENKLVEGSLVTDPEKKTFTSFRYPQHTANGIIAEKSSFDDIRSFVLINNGTETKVFRPGNITPDHTNLVHNNGLLTWAENTYHPRWNLVDYGVIYSYDLISAKKKKLTRRSKFYGPAPSSNHKSIVAIEYLKNGSQSLVILKESDGSTIHRFDNNEFGQYNYPRFTLDDQFIIVGFTSDRGNTLRKYKVNSQDYEDLIPFSNQVSTRPFDTRNFIIFSGTFTGINNIYAIQKTTGELFQITSSRFGAFDPTVNSDETKLVYSDYTATGYNIREMDFIFSEWKPFSLSEKSMLTFHKPLDEKEGGNILPQIENEIYVSSRFRPTLQGLFNFHTWTPSIAQNEIGVEVVSTNIFNNTSATIAARYNINDKLFVTSGKLIYGALFPLFDVAYAYNSRTDKLVFDDNYASTNYTWKEHNLIGGIQLPFKLSKGTFNTQLNLAGSYTHHIIREIPNEPVPFSDEFGSINAGITFQNLQSRNRQQLISRWGQVLGFDLQQNNESENMGHMILGIGEFYFPGFSKTHSINLKTRYMEENLKGYRFEDRFEMARGYNDRLFQNKADTDFDNIYVISGNYELPVLFPDWDLGSIAYLRAISVNLFYDHSLGSRNNQESLMRSTGLDIIFEIFTLRLLSTSLTLRTLYRFDQPDPEMDPIYFNIIFNVLDIAF